MFEHSSEAMPHSMARQLKAYYELTKPRVVALIVFTAIVGMFLASPGLVPLETLFYGTLGIGLAASAAAVINQVVDHGVDARMARTSHRPIPMGSVPVANSLIFAGVLAVLAMFILIVEVNVLTAVLTVFSLIGYAFIYTMYLKRATPQNIVIGGAAGAAPPVLGWTAVTNHLDPHALLLFLIIFVWTPPHFWALAIHRRDEYAQAGIPMLPVTHGVSFTRLQILLYTLLLMAVSILPFAAGMSGLLYLVAVLLLDAGFLYYALAMYWSARPDLPMRTFGYSITYLMGLFTFLLLDHYIPIEHWFH